MKETFPIENDPQKQASGTIESPPAPIERRHRKFQFHTWIRPKQSVERMTLQKVSKLEQ